jgi:hypothetical protein
MPGVLRLRYKGERVVGETLNQLLAMGVRVFHDVPFDGFNIDHVLVGKSGVYAVETKTRRKPKLEKGRRAEVVYDGTSLHFPNGSDEKALEQARLNARALSKWLTESTGETVLVKAILTFPGWWIERKAAGDVCVVNPDEIEKYLSGAEDEMLDEGMRRRIVFQLMEKCKMAEA